MSNPINLKAIEERCEKATKMISDLCHQRTRWVMSIPARRDTDPDLVIGDSIQDNEALVAWVGRARTLLRHYSRWCSRGYCVRGNECSLCRENLKLQEELRDE